MLKLSGCWVHKDMVTKCDIDATSFPKRMTYILQTKNYFSKASLNNNITRSESGQSFGFEALQCLK